MEKGLIMVLPIPRPFELSFHNRYQILYIHWETRWPLFLCFVSLLTLHLKHSFFLHSMYLLRTTLMKLFFFFRPILNIQFSLKFMTKTMSIFRRFSSSRKWIELEEKFSMRVNQKWKIHGEWLSQPSLAPFN